MWLQVEEMDVNETINLEDIKVEDFVYIFYGGGPSTLKEHVEYERSIN